ncbi:pentapeptide repeat-containing protein [Treponema sp. TIM-1]|uniref:pentapeptide repeat-containing protein n=1 Tax=Treponema sp. TIM-1 TaxID=2898417 RepID=UPI00398108F5
MFKVIPCAAGCGHTALSGSTTCAVHAADPGKEAARIAAYIHDRKIIKDLNAAGLRFESVDFSHRHFYGCNFIRSEFSMCLFTENLVRMSFFDFGIFTNCDFSKSDLQFLSFAGSTLRNCTFENSELVNINYGGAVISDCTFNYSNLYNSRFIDSVIELTDFIDCNVKKTYFIKSKQEGISFKSSNTAEAVFELEE